MILTRRTLIGGLAPFIAAPAIIRVADIMRIKPSKPELIVDTPFGTVFIHSAGQWYIDGAAYIPKQLSNFELQRLTAS